MRRVRSLRWVLVPRCGRCSVRCRGCCESTHRSRTAMSMASTMSGHSSTPIAPPLQLPAVPQTITLAPLIRPRATTNVASAAGDSVAERVIIHLCDGGVLRSLERKLLLPEATRIGNRVTSSSRVGVGTTGSPVSGRGRVGPAPQKKLFAIPKLVVVLFDEAGVHCEPRCRIVRMRSFPPLCRAGGIREFDSPT